MEEKCVIGYPDYITSNTYFGQEEHLSLDFIIQRKWEVILLLPSECEEEYGLAKVTLHKLRSVPVNNSGRIRLITVHQPVGRSEGSAILRSKRIMMTT